MKSLPAGKDSEWESHSTAMLQLLIFFTYGTEELKKRLLPKTTTGEAICAIAFTEPNAGSDLAAIRTKAVRDGDHYIINGQKTFITNGIFADIIITACKTGRVGEIARPFPSS